jgi:hypothetical protein
MTTPLYVTDLYADNPLLSYASFDGFDLATESYAGLDHGIRAVLSLDLLPGAPLPYVYQVIDSRFDDSFNTLDAPNAWVTLTGGNDGVTLGSGSALVTQAAGVGNDAYLFHAGALPGDMLSFKHADNPVSPGHHDFIWFLGFGAGAQLEAVAGFQPHGYAATTQAPGLAWQGYQVVSAEGHVLLGAFGVAFAGAPGQALGAGDYAFG